MSVPLLLIGVLVNLRYESGAIGIVLALAIAIAICMRVVL